MKISSEETVANIITAFLFVLGIIIYLKIGFINWILICSAIYFFIIKDKKFMETIIPSNEFANVPIYGMIWFTTILMPVVLLLMYLGSRLTGHIQEEDD